MTENVCQNCGRSDADTPMVFKGQPWCSDDCRKKIQGEEKSELSIAAM